MPTTPQQNLVALCVNLILQSDTLTPTQLEQSYDALVTLQRDVIEIFPLESAIDQMPLGTYNSRLRANLGIFGPEPPDNEDDQYDEDEEENEEEGEEEIEGVR